MAFFVLILLFVVSPQVADGHAMGASLEKVIGAYHIDIGYDPAILMGGDRVVFDFTLLQAAASTSVPFDYVWVRLRANDQALLSTGVHKAELGPTSLLLELAEETEGDLEVYVRYQKDDETLAESEFMIPVLPYEDPNRWHEYVIALGILVFGVCMGGFPTYWWARRRHA
jgi:hypothetical protein